MVSGPRHLTFLPIVLAIAMILSGCSSKSTKSEAGGEDAIAPTAAPGEHDDTTCAITGSVLDDQYAAVAGAEVALFGTDIPTTVSAQDGGFSFSFLPPGQYQVVASLIHYESGIESVLCEAGDQKNVPVTLTPVADPDVPYPVRFQPVDGFIGCALGFMSVQSGDFCAAQYPGVARFEFPYHRDDAVISGAVVEVQWNPSSGGGGATLLLDLTDVPRAKGYTVTPAQTPDGGFNFRGGPPIKVRVESDDPTDSLFTKNSNVTYKVRPNGGGSDASRAVSDSSKLLLNQNFKVYVTYFYNGAEIPDGYTQLDG